MRRKRILSVASSPRHLSLRPYLSRLKNRFPHLSRLRALWKSRKLRKLSLLLILLPPLGSLMSCGTTTVDNSQQSVVVIDKRIQRGQCKPVPPPDKEESAKRTDQEMVPILGQVIILQNGVIAKCIEQIDSGNDYLDQVNEELKKR